MALGSAGALASLRAAFQSEREQIQPADPGRGGRHASEEPDAVFWGEGDERRRRYLAPAVLAALALLLILSAYGIGKLFSNQVSDVDTSEPAPPDGVALDESGSTAGSNQDDKGGKKKVKKYHGPVAAASIGGGTASCQSASSVDAAGNPVDYKPDYVYDGNLSTAWRCDGDGSGESLTIDLAEETAIGEVGLVPGYAKTDPDSGEDRYAENNRITKVRWVFSDGSSVVQRFDGSPDNRDMQTMRIPRTTADQVVVKIMTSTSGPRNTVAISELRIGAVAG